MDAGAGGERLDGGGPGNEQGTSARLRPGQGRLGLLGRFCQRTVLFWDVMRKRGNQAIEHYQKGKPPVLVFDYELVIDGRTLERPVNYMLLRIKPEPAARPIRRSSRS